MKDIGKWRKAMSSHPLLFSSLDVAMYMMATHEERNEATQVHAGTWEESFRLALTPERFEALRAMALVNIAGEK